MVTVKKGEFVSVEFSGYTHGELFDSNKVEDMKQLDPEGKQEAKPLKVIVGEGMVVKGFDKALEGAEVGKEKEVTFPASEGYGERHRSLVRVIPLKVFAEQNIQPRPGMSLMLQQGMMKIVSVGGARVTADLNHPLAGKELTFNILVKEKIEDEKRKVELVLRMLFRQVPSYKLEGTNVVVEGPKALEQFVLAFKEKFTSLLGKGLVFEEKEGKSAEGNNNNNEKQLDNGKGEGEKDENSVD